MSEIKIETEDCGFYKGCVLESLTTNGERRRWIVTGYHRPTKLLGVVRFTWWRRVVWWFRGKFSRG